MGCRLFFCRTPLQALIVNRLLERIPGAAVVVYYPTTSSGKHRYYFEKISTGEKHFVTWKPPRISDTLTDVVAWFRIPRSVRHRSYESLFIASIGSIPFALFVRANPEGKVYTFDDGAFNLSETTFRDRIYEEPPIRRLIKSLLRVCDNPGLIGEALRHYTIFPKDFVVGIRSPIEEVDLFKDEIDKMGPASLCKIRILLGSWFADSNLQSRHDLIVKSGKFDLFLPHPADMRPPVVASWIREAGVGFDPVKMIAEDAVAALVMAGYRPVVYGFNSTALISLACFVRTVSIFLAPDRETIVGQVMFRLGVRRLRCYDFENAG